MPAQLQPQAEFIEQVHAALKLYHRDASYGSPVAHLRVVQRALAGGRANLRSATNDVLMNALTGLEREMPDHAQVLRLRFLDQLPVHTVANKLNVGNATVYRRQGEALKRLAEIIEQMEMHAAQEVVALGKSHLPPAPYTFLVGVDRHLERLEKVLRWPDLAIVGLFGIGGIGKSSLAHRLAVRLAVEQSEFATAVWISAKQQAFHTGGVIQNLGCPALTPADLLEELTRRLLPQHAWPVPFSIERALPVLRQYFAAARTLVVIDNLETVEDVTTLLPVLRQLAHPTRFVLTSRHGLPGEPDLHPFTVPELSAEDAFYLLRREAMLYNVVSLGNAADADLALIYETVGGNPLALKLVVGQVALLPLDRVLANLRKAVGSPQEALYQYIYRTSWEQLSPDEQEVLATLALFSQEGADLTTIEARCEVKSPLLEQALAHLVRLSLVNVSGDLYSRRYSIHRLTETFLRKEVFR